MAIFKCVFCVLIMNVILKVEGTQDVEDYDDENLCACPQENGRFSNPTERDRYYECKDGNVGSEKFISILSINISFRSHWYFALKDLYFMSPLKYA